MNAFILEHFSDYFFATLTFGDRRSSSVHSESLTIVLSFCILCFWKIYVVVPILFLGCSLYVCMRCQILYHVTRILPVFPVSPVLPLQHIDMQNYNIPHSHGTPGNCASRLYRCFQLIYSVTPRWAKPCQEMWGCM